MNPHIKKIVFVIQDLLTKEKESVAVLSGDIHLNTTDKAKTISFQMLLSDNKDFARAIKDISAQAIQLHNEKTTKKSSK